MSDIIEQLAGLSPILIYLVIGAGAAIENIVPLVPADTFVLFGAFLAAAGRADPRTVFAITWFANVAAAVGVYILARKYGRAFFETTAGHWLLRPHQLESIGRFYERWGTLAIFVSRFLPGFRATVPVFAGIHRVRLMRLLLPLASASALWYGALVMLGAAAGRRWETILEMFSRVSSVLLWVAVVGLTLVLVWWWRTREHSD